jgi:TRAP-type C4-dicarboxylate transport system substrate-binding protein
MKETTDYNWKLVEEVDRQAVEKMKAAGTKFFDLSPEERKRWVAQTRKVLTDYEKTIGKDVMQAVYGLSN